VLTVFLLFWSQMVLRLVQKLTKIMSSQSYLSKFVSKLNYISLYVNYEKFCTKNRTFFICHLGKLTHCLGYFDEDRRLPLLVNYWKILTVHKIPVFIRQFIMITRTSLQVIFFGNTFWLSSNDNNRNPNDTCNNNFLMTKPADTLLSVVYATFFFHLNMFFQCYTCLLNAKQVNLVLNMLNMFRFIFFS